MASKAACKNLQPWMFLFGLALVCIGFSFPVKSLHSQSIYFCHSHTPEGKPIGVTDTFELRHSGESVEFVFDNEKPLDSPKLYFFVDLWANGRFEEFDTKTAIVQHGSTWAAIEYRFSRSGAYRVQVLTADKEVLCSKQLGVSITENEDLPSYFEGARILVCTAAPNGKPIDTLRKYSQRAGQTTMLTLLLNHVRPIGTSRVYVDVWTGSGDGEDIFLETIELATEPSWPYMQFKYEFKSYGAYTFRFYNENEVYIGSTGMLIEPQ